MGLGPRDAPATKMNNLIDVGVGVPEAKMGVLAETVALHRPALPAPGGENLPLPARTDAAIR